MPSEFGILLVPDFCMLTYLSLCEPLRIANRLSGRDLFAWKTISESGGPVTAFNGISVSCEAGIRSARGLQSIVVCAGRRPSAAVAKPLLAWLRREARHGASIGAVDAGSCLLAEAGLVDGHRVALRRDAMPGFLARYPKAEVADEAFVFDRGRFSCAGGAACLDMMLHVVRALHGSGLAAAVADQLAYPAMRDRSDTRQSRLAERTGVTNPALLRAISFIEECAAQPVRLDAVARAAGISQRQLQRLFAIHLGDTPKRYCQKIRLERARSLLQQSRMNVLDTAIACGFSSSSHFSQAFRLAFGHSPGKVASRSAV